MKLGKRRIVEPGDQGPGESAALKVQRGDAGVHRYIKGHRTGDPKRREMKRKRSERNGSFSSRGFFEGVGGPRGGGYSQHRVHLGAICDQDPARTHAVARTAVRGHELFMLSVSKLLSLRHQFCSCFECMRIVTAEALPRPKPKNRVKWGTIPGAPVPGPLMISPTKTTRGPALHQ